MNNLGKLLTGLENNNKLNPNSKLVLFSMDPSLGEIVRASLYSFTSNYFNIELIVDGGDFNGNSTLEKIQKIYDLAFIQQKTLVLIGVQPEFIVQLQQQLNTECYPHRLTIISDNGSPSDELDLNSLYLKEVNIVGFQRQNTCIENRSIQYIRQGEYKSNPTIIEPPIRRSDVIYFNLNAIRYSDSPGNYLKNPSGLFAEDASRISRLAGNSERLNIFAISAWDEQKDPEKISATLVAQMIWYFWEGCHLKQLDQHTNRSSMTQYLVEIKHLDYILKFYKSENSGKWWFEEPLIDNEFSNQLVPCTYDEYLASAKDQIPGRILEMIQG